MDTSEMFHDRAAVNPASRDEESLFLAQPTQRCYRLRNRAVHPQAGTDRQTKPYVETQDHKLLVIFKQDFLLLLLVFGFFCLLVLLFFCETLHYLHFIFSHISLVMMHSKRKGSISWCSLAQTIYFLQNFTSNSYLIKVGQNTFFP